MRQNPYPIALEGIPFIVAAAVLTASIVFFFDWWWGILPCVLCLFCIWFFRDPKRIPPPEVDQSAREAVLSPADGTVIAISNVDEKRVLNQPLRRISIFMSPLNVHVNRAPVTGKIIKTLYNAGKFFNAAAEKSSLENEQNAILMQSQSGFNVLFVQIAGFIARRIVCYVKPGDIYNRSERVGLIRFGSRVDVYLPMESEITVGMKQKVVAGETILGRLPKKGSVPETPALTPGG